MNKPVYYCQWDAKWGNIPYTIDGDITTETIGKSGCGPTSMAMILSTWVDKNITPVDTCKLAIQLKDRTASNGTEWEFFGHVADKYNLKFKQTNVTAEAVAALKDNALVVCSMGPGYFTKHGHFILAYGADANNIYVNDPNNSAKTQAAISLFRQQCVQYFIFYKPSNAIKPPIVVDSIRDVQAALIALKYNCGVSDGIAGPKTTSAIKKFQQDNKLVADGIAGPATKAKLRELLCK